MSPIHKILMPLAFFFAATLPCMSFSQGGGGGSDTVAPPRFFEHEFTTQASIGSGYGLALSFHVPASVKAPVMTFRWKVSGESSIKLIQDAAWIDQTGVPRLIVNKNLNSSVKSKLVGKEPAQMIIDPIGISGGADIFDERFFFPEAGKSASITLRPGKSYALVWKSNEASGAQLICDWTEYEPNL